MPYVVVDAHEIEPGFGGAFRQIRRQLGVRAFGINRVDLPSGAAGRPHAGPEGLSWVVVGAPPREYWEPEL